jgi:hypothetical protein
MTRSKLSALLQRAARFNSENGNAEDEVTADDAVDAISDAIEEVAEIKDTVTAGVIADNVVAIGPIEADETATPAEPRRAKYEPTDRSGEGSYGQKRMLTWLSVDEDDEKLSLLHKDGTPERIEVDATWDAGQLFDAIQAMLSGVGWVHPNGLTLYPDTEAVERFKARKGAA